MPLKIRYIGHGREIKTVPFNGTREDAAKAAVDGISHENADGAEIRDDQDNLIGLVDFSHHA